MAGVFQTNVFQSDVFQRSSFTSTGGATFGFSESLTGSETFTGTIGVDYIYDSVSGVLVTDSVTDDPVTASDAELGRMVFSVSVAGTAAQTFTGTGSAAFGFSEALAGTEKFTGTAAVAFGFSEALAGAETFTGTGALAFTFSESASGEATGDTTGTAALAFGFSEDGAGQNDSIVGGHGGRGIIRRYQPTPKPIPLPLPLFGDTAVVFGFRIAAQAETNDDDLALLLAA